MFAALSQTLFPHSNRLSPAAAGILLLLGFCIFTPGLFSLPPTDRDEARFAQASKQMIESGNFVDIRFQEEVRYKKPVGVYWLQAGVVKAAQVLGFDTAPQVIGLYRLPSLFAAMFSVLLTASIGARLFGAREGFIAGALLASCVLMNVEARLAKTDAALLCATLLCMHVMAKAYVRAGLPQPLKPKDFFIFWGALAAGILIKGPIILLAVAGTPLVLRFLGEKFRWLKPLNFWMGVPFALLLILPWFVAISLQSHGAFFKDSAGQDLLAKIWQGQNWGGAPPGYHTLASLGVMWPASLPVWLALPWLWQNRREPALRFLVSWALPVWVVFELVFTKLPHYVLPAYPALILAASSWMCRKEHEGKPPLFWRLALLIIWACVSVGICLVPAVLPVFAEDQIFFFPIFFAGLALGLALAAVQLFRRDQRRYAPLPLALAGAILAFSLFRFLFVHMPSVFLSPQITAQLDPPGQCVQTTLAIAGYTEPSLVFLAGTGTKLLPSGEEVALALSADPCLTAAVAQDEGDDKAKGELAGFKNTLSGLGIRAKEIAKIEGFNYGRGKKTTILLYQTGS
jgi:4-amino-4-deoxy-L-arabinose transferase-like glycosyltransferase